MINLHFSPASDTSLYLSEVKKSQEKKEKKNRSKVLLSSLPKKIKIVSLIGKSNR